MTIVFSRTNTTSTVLHREQQGVALRIIATGPREPLLQNLLQQFSFEQRCVNEPSTQGATDLFENDRKRTDLFSRSPPDIRSGARSRQAFSDGAVFVLELTVMANRAFSIAEVSEISVIEGRKL